MGVVRMKGSPFWWFNLERPGQRPLRTSSKILVDGGTPEQTKENRALAQAAYAAAMGDLARDRFELPSDRQVRLFKDHATWYETHHTALRRSSASRLREQRALRYLSTAFGKFPLALITPTSWQEYVTMRIGEGVGHSTIGRELAVLKAVLATAVGPYLDVHPLAGVRRKTDKVKPKRTLTAAEERRLITALRRIDREIADMYVVGLGTLLRQENLVFLQRGSHRGDRLVVDTKTGPHSVPLKGPTELQRRAAAVLTRRTPKAADGYYFPTWRAKFAPYEDSGHPRVLFLKKVKRAVKAIDVPWGLEQGGVVWHTLTRASGATRLLRDYKLDVRTVQVIGGWTSLDQMAQYLGVDRDALFEAPPKRVSSR